LFCLSPPLFFCGRRGFTICGHARGDDNKDVTTIDAIALGLVVAALATMPVFAFTRRGKPMDADVARRSTSVLLGYWVRDWLMWAIGPVERALVRARVSPDVFNYLGVFFGICAGVAFAMAELSLAGWMDADLFVRGLKGAGPEFTQQKVVDAINSSRNWTADGIGTGVDWTIEHDTAATESCFALVKIESGKLVPKFGEPGKPFVCLDNSDPNLPDSNKDGLTDFMEWDANGNGQWDSGETYTDLNGSASFDEDIGEEGVGAASEIVQYTIGYDWQMMILPFITNLPVFP